MRKDFSGLHPGNIVLVLKPKICKGGIGLPRGVPTLTFRLAGGNRKWLTELKGGRNPRLFRPEGSFGLCPFQAMPPLWECPFDVKLTVHTCMPCTIFIDWRIKALDPSADSNEAEGEGEDDDEMSGLHLPKEGHGCRSESMEEHAKRYVNIV